MARASGIDDEILSLPTGGGAVSGIGDTFDVDLNTGTASSAIALELPPGPNGVRPELAIRYHSGAGDGLLGLGWTLDLPAITREPRPAPQAPVYTLGSVGVLRQSAPGQWRPEVDNLSPMIAGDPEGGAAWRLVDTTDTVHFLGSDPSTRIPGADGLPVTWVLDRIVDAFGNAVTYTWLRDGGQLYPQRILWGTWQLDFVYEPRPDRLLDGHLGVLIETTLRCARIELRAPSQAAPLVRSWEMGYSDQAGLGRSLLASVTIVGHAADGTRAESPPTRFGYTTIGAATLDGLAGWQPGSLRATAVDFVDLSGGGLPDAIDLGSGDPAVWRNLGRGAWSGPHRLNRLPSPLRLDSRSVSFADMNGDAAADLLLLDRPLSGYFPFNTRPWTRPDADATAAGLFDRPVIWRQAPSYSLQSPDVKLLDLNGDSLTDLLVDTGRAWMAYTQDADNGWVERPSVLPGDATPPVRLRDPRVFLANLTGDGGQDVIHVEGDALRYWPSLGAARWGAARTMKIAGAPARLDPRRVLFADVDGDGCADLVYVDFDRVLVFWNTGSDRMTGPTEIRAVPANSPGGFRALDLDGSGTIGVLFDAILPSGRHRPLYLRPTGGEKPFLLASIDHGTGATTTISYRSSTEFALDDRDAGQPWQTFHPFPVQCVAEVVRADATTGSAQRTRYQYHDARFDPASRTFVGFGRVTTEALGDESAPTLRSVSEFHVGLDPADPFRALGPEERLTLGALRRRPLTVTSRGVNGDGSEQSPITITRYTYATQSTPSLDGGTIVLPYVKSTVEERYGGLPAVLRTHRLDLLDVDERGNVRKQRSTVTAADGTVARDLTIDTTLATGGENLRLPARATQRGPDGAVVAVTISYYDGPDHVGLPEGQATLGFLSRTEDLVLTDNLVQTVWGTSPPDLAALGYHRLSGESGWWVTRSSRAQSVVGGARVLVSRGPRGAETTVRLDTTGQLVDSITDARGNATSAGYDARSGQVSRLTDANGTTSQDLFDALGRVVGTLSPGDAPDAPGQTFSYRTATLPLRVDAAQRADATGPARTATITYFDGLGRVLARLTPAGPVDGAPPGSPWLVAQAHRFNARGMVATSWLPYLAADDGYAPPPDAEQHVQLTYNAAGQLVREERPDGRVVTYESTPSGVVIRSGPTAGPLRDRERHDLDACGQILRVSRWDGARWVTQSHAWDARGRMVRTTTPDGAVVELVYDLMGRPLRHTSPETGVTLRLFDANGSEVLRRNAAGQEVRREYDALRRPLGVYYSGAAQPDVTYEYLDAGSPAPSDGTRFRIGRLWRVTDPVGVVEVAYDEMGRTVSSTRSGAPVAGSFTTDVSYNRLGHITRVVLPATTAGGPREQVDYTYDEAGRPQTASGVISSVAYDRFGRMTQLRYANGALTVSEYDPTTGRLTHQKVTAPDGSTLSEQTAAYDGDGQLASLTGPGGPGDLTTFDYDGLNRLVGVHRPGVAPEAYAYSDGGNMTSGALGAMTYQPGSGLLQSAGGQGYGHDAAGRLASAPYGALRFDADDHLVAVTLSAGGLVEHAYDHLGRHALTRRDGAIELLVLGEQLEIHGDRATLWLTFGGRRIVAVSGTERRWLHPDLRGNVSLVTDEAGKAVFSAVYSAYGLLVAAAGPGATAGVVGSGFLGSAADETGLVCLGVRWYDPRLGRFISPDPMVGGIYVIDTWNPYVYGHDNPVVFVNPTGAWSFWGVLGVALLVTAIVVAAVFTGGAALSGLGVLATTGLFGTSLSVGTLVTVGIGAFGGALAGGLSAMKAGGDVWGGALLGGVIGGACALAGGAIGSGIIGSLGRTYGGFMLSGAVQGAIGGFGSGFAVGFAGGKGSLGAALLAGLRGAIWGAFLGMVLGFGTRFLFIGGAGEHNYFELGTMNRYIPDMAPKGNPSSFAVWDNSLGTSEDAVFTGSHIANNTLGASDAGGIIDITCIRDIGPQAFKDLNGATAAFFKDGSFFILNLNDVATAMGNGGMTLAASASVMLDDNGLSYAQQFAMLLKALPFFGNVLAFADEYKLGWYEDTVHGLNVFWGSRSADSSG